MAIVLQVAHEDGAVERLQAVAERRRLVGLAEDEAGGVREKCGDHVFVLVRFTRAGRVHEGAARLDDPGRPMEQGELSRGQAREVEVRIRPPRPLALSTLQEQPPGGPAEIQRMLGLTATAR